MPKHDKTKIISMVTLMERDREKVHARMDGDMDYFNLVPYKGESDENGIPLMDDFKKVTSNDPRNYGRLSIHLISNAKRILKVPQQNDQKDVRTLKNMKELFALGVLSAADERRQKLLMPTIQGSLASQTALRGRRAQRVLLVKEEIDPTPEQEAERKQFEELGLGALLEDVPTTRTFVDVTDWDPRNTYWGMGRHGLVWACHKQSKSIDEIQEEYPDVDFFEDNYGQEKVYDVYDYLDEEDNLVFIDNIPDLKSRTPHGMGQVPAAIGMVGDLPVMQASGENYEEFYGESIYSSDREMFDQNNFILSYEAEACRRALNPGAFYRSRDGSKTIEGRPFTSDALTPLADGEVLEQFPQQEMIQTGALLHNEIKGMMQRGGYDYTSFGQLGQTLSGFAITQLRQGQELLTGPALESSRQGIEDIANIIADGYATGNFDTMTLSGRLQDVQRTYFSEEITPDIVSEGGKIEIRLTSSMPQDDASKAALVGLLRQGEVPVVDDRFLREHILEYQDPDQIERAIMEQAGKRGSPIALAYSAALAMEEQGDEEMAKIWEAEFQILMLQKLAELRQTQQGVGQGPPTPGGGPPIPGGGNAPPGQLSPANLPGAVQGLPPPLPTPQQGPIAAPGTPRPNRATRRDSRI